MMPKIVIPDDCPLVMAASPVYRGLASEFPVDCHDTLPGSAERLVERIREADIVINIRASTKFTAEVLHRCPNLRLISVWGTGTDNVDLASAQARGITVTNTPGVAAVAVAEHCLALMLAVARGVPRLDNETRRGRWPRGEVTQLHGKTLGIMGLGAIGRQFARLGEGIGMKVIAWTLHPNPALGFDLVSFEDLFRHSDVVSVHLRLSPETEGLLGRREFGWMKPTAILVNTARGPIVDEEALVEALSTGRIAGAGLDVFETEPLPPGHPFTRLSNVVLTPHSAGITAEALQAGLQMAADNVRNFLAGNPTNVVLPRRAGHL